MFAMEPSCDDLSENYRTKPGKVCKLWRDISLRMIAFHYRKPYINWTRLPCLEWSVTHNYTLMKTMFVGENLFFDYGLGKCSHLKQKNFGKFGKYFSEMDIRVRCDSEEECKYISFIKYIMILLYTTTYNKTFWFKNSIVFEYDGATKGPLNRDTILFNLGRGFIPGCNIVDVTCDFMAIQFQTCVVILRRVCGCHYDPILTMRNVKKCFFRELSLYVLTTQLSLYLVEDVNTEALTNDLTCQLLSDCVYDIAKNNKPQEFDILAIKSKGVMTCKGTRMKKYPVKYPQMMGPKPIISDVSVTNGLFMIYRTNYKWVLYDIRKKRVIPCLLGKNEQNMYISDGLFFYYLVNNRIARL